MLSMLDMEAGYNAGEVANPGPIWYLQPGLGYYDADRRNNSNSKLIDQSTTGK